MRGGYQQGDKVQEQMQRHDENDEYNKNKVMGEATEFLVFAVVVAQRLLRSRRKNFGATPSSLRYFIFREYLSKEAANTTLAYKRLIKKKINFFRRPILPFDNKFLLSYFVGALRREKYYFSLLRMKRLFLFSTPRHRVNLRRTPLFYRNFIIQFYHIWAFGRVYKLYRSVLKEPFSDLFISYDNFKRVRCQQSILRLRQRKYYLLKTLSKKRRKYLRPWKFYKLRWKKITKRRFIVHLGLSRIKRFMRNTGVGLFVFRYQNLLNRWNRLFQKQTAYPFSYKRNLEYFSPFKTITLRQLKFYAELYYVFFKKKKNNFYLTLTNGFGEVLFHNSSGRLLKFRRNKKVRSSLINLPGLASTFVRRLVRRKIFRITRLYRPAGMSKRALKTIYNVFSGSGVVIKNLVKNSKRPHSFCQKTKKVRRL